MFTTPGLTIQNLVDELETTMMPSPSSDEQQKPNKKRKVVGGIRRTLGGSSRYRNMHPDIHRKIARLVAVESKQPLILALDEDERRLLTKVRRSLPEHVVMKSPSDVRAMDVTGRNIVFYPPFGSRRSDVENILRWAVSLIGKAGIIVAVQPNFNDMTFLSEYVFQAACVVNFRDPPLFFDDDGNQAPSAHRGTTLLCFNHKKAPREDGAQPVLHYFFDELYKQAFHHRVLESALALEGKCPITEEPITDTNNPFGIGLTEECRGHLLEVGFRALHDGSFMFGSEPTDAENEAEHLRVANGFFA
jgi:hypothetical protein